MNSRRGLTDLPAELHENVRQRLAKHSRQDPSGCVIWTGALNRAGYGMFSVNRKIQSGPHRISWILANGPIASPELVIDHLCRTPACIRPDHLEPVTSLENSLRGASLTGTRELCKNGHSRELYMSRSGKGHQNGYCRACNHRRTQCPNGHGLEHQVKRKQGDKYRNACLLCERARGARIRAAKRDALADSAIRGG